MSGLLESFFPHVIFLMLLPCIVTPQTYVYIQVVTILEKNSSL